MQIIIPFILALIIQVRIFTFISKRHKPLQIEGRTIPTFPDIIKEILSIVIITTAFVGFLLYTNDVDFDTIEVVALYAQPIVWLGIYINIKNMFGKQDQ
jgi:hypothetical protein